MSSFKQQRQNRTREERKRVKEQLKAVKRIPRSTQQTLAFDTIFENGICQVKKGVFSKTIAFDDMNYQISRQEDKIKIFENYCDFLNYFDSTIDVQLTLINEYIDTAEFERSILIPLAQDGLDTYRIEYNDMLMNQVKQGKNSIRKSKYLTITIQAESIEQATQQLNRIEIDVLNNFKALGCGAVVLDGRERLELLHNILRQNTGNKFSFDYAQTWKTGLTVKDFIAPNSFNFTENKTFKMGDTLCSASFLRVTAPELSDAFLKELSDLNSNMVISINLRSVRQELAMKRIKRQLAMMESNKIEEQRKAVKQGFDMDLIPSDLKNYIKEAENFLEELQNRNQRMFESNFLILNTGRTEEELQSDLFHIRSLAQKYNCDIQPLEEQQEAGLNSILPIGHNKIEIKRTLTTASTAIFIPFTTQELLQPRGMYYGLNALSYNLIMFDRKSLKNPNGFILGTPGCLTGDTKVRLADGTTETLAELQQRGTDVQVQSYNDQTGQFVAATATDPRISGTVKELIKITLDSGDTIQCTGNHLILNSAGKYIPAEELQPGNHLSGGHIAEHIEAVKLSAPVIVYDLTVEGYLNFVLDNGVIVHNSGKSFAGKREMVNVLLNTDDDVIVIDPEREYAPLAAGFGGELIHISAGSRTHINPLDISLDYSDDDDPLLLKSEFVLSLCDLLVGGRAGLGAKQKSIIDRVVSLTYADYMRRPESTPMPTLVTFLDKLRSQKDEEAKDLAVALELYVTGSLKVFAQQTNINTENRFIVFDIKDLGKQLKTMGLLIVLDQVWNRITQNRGRGKRTWLYIDEIYLLFANEYSANFLFELYKRARKWGGIPTGITQNVEDLLQSDLARRMLSNSDFLLMLNQAPSDRAELAKLLNISDQQLSYVTNSNAGQGLLFSGSAIIPFVDKFPTNTALYRQMTTKVDEIAAIKAAAQEEHADDTKVS